MRDTFNPRHNLTQWLQSIENHYPEHLGQKVETAKSTLQYLLGPDAKTYNLVATITPHSKNYPTLIIDRKDGHSILQVSTLDLSPPPFEELHGSWTSASKAQTQYDAILRLEVADA
tara:strand:- start:400 stop:747 length:348 start_codon:yes stop_codon:yes gene_type:complete